MNWHKKMIFRNGFALLVSLLLMVGAIVLFIFAIIEGETSGAFLFGFITLFMGFATYSSYKQHMDAIQKQKEAVQENLLSELKSINKYHSIEELSAAFNSQKHNILYQDDEITITNGFMKEKGSGRVFIIDGILDAVSYVHKVNGIINYVSLIFLYYNGNSYKIKYERPLGISNMQKIVDSTSHAVNIIATKSENFRKYPAYRLT